MLNYIRNEPARIMGLVLAVLALGAAFGLSLTDEQTAAVVAFVGAVLVLAGAETTRSQVTPVRPKRRRSHTSIGSTGSTGKSSGPHLHFEARDY